MKNIRTYLVSSLIVFLLILSGALFFLKKEKDFTIIVLPDTQKYFLDKEDSEVFKGQIEWILENKDLMNIRFVTHEGDIVENWDNEGEWQKAKSIINLLFENEVPFSVVPGNHDHKGYDTKGSSFFYNKYFPEYYFSNKKWWGGSYNGNDNNYQLLNIEGIEFIFLNLDWCPSQDEIEWANSILDKYPERRAILTTHGYLDDATSTRKGIHGCHNTNYIWDDLVKKHENLQIVLSGHEHDDDGEAFRRDVNLSGRQVYQMMADYQGEPNGGNGWLRILLFSPSDDKIYIKTYSPYLDKYEEDSNSQFILDYNMAGN